MSTNNSLSRFANNIVCISNKNEKLGDIKYNAQKILTKKND